MQKFETLRQPLLGELAMSWRERERESGHLRLCQQPRAAHTLRSDQNWSLLATYRLSLESMSTWNVIAWYKI